MDTINKIRLACSQEKPMKVKELVNSILNQKMATKKEQLKQNIAKSLYSS